MKKITQEELNVILENHKHWLNEDCNNLENMKADLSSADLRSADLRYVNLRCADLIGADLRGAYLRGADLRGADLSGADLRGADLRGTDLRGADLRYANLSGADLNCVNYNEFTSFLALQCPEEGTFIGYKKVNDFIIKLLILEDAKRSSATSRKCRCDKAKVVSITKLDGSDSGLTEIYNTNYNGMLYKVNEVSEVTDFDDNRWNECSTGIHFFITRQEAVNYYML